MKRDSRWTDAQWQAITARGGDLLVAAGAGAGKTAVLVERILGRIREGVDIDRMLIVTFTNAAAAEMRERIGKALEHEAAQLEGTAAGRMREQVILLGRAPITTLHSFCLDLMRKNYYRLGLDPAFRVADDTETELLRADVLEQVIERAHEADGASTADVSGAGANAAGAGTADETAQEALGEAGSFARLADAYGSDRDDSGLFAVIMQIDRQAMSQPWPRRWLEAAAEAFERIDQDNFEDHPWFQALRRQICEDLADAGDALAQALRITDEPGGPAAYKVNLLQEQAMVQQLEQAAQRSWKALYAALPEATFGRLKAVRNVDEELKKAAQTQRDKAKKVLKDLVQKYAKRPPAAWVDDLRRIAPDVRTLVNTVLAFQEAYRQAKAAKRIVDFADLEHFALRLLLDPASTPDQPMPSEAALELRRHFSEVLTDEYQDINAVQEMVLTMVAQQNRFMVGDVKQSIYRFRLADPGLFLTRYRCFAGAGATENSATAQETAGRPAELSPGRAIDLAKNFRSRAEIIDAVNDLFRLIMRREVADMDYDSRAELVSGALYPPLPGGGPLVELRLLGAEEQSETTNDVLFMDALDGLQSDEGQNPTESDAEAEGILDAERDEIEARTVVESIRALMEAGTEVYDRDLGGMRPLRYRDIVVLLRSTKNRAPIYMEAFRQAQLPAYAELGTGYLATTEITVMLSLLQLIDNPQQDIPLAAVLRSPLFGFAADTLARIRLAAPAENYYRALQHCLEPGVLSDGDQLVPQLQRFLTQLEAWRTQARQGTVTDLIWQIYRDTGYFAYVSAMPGGLQRQANLRALHDRARQFEATSYRGLFRFLRFIRRLQEKGDDLGAARALGETEDVVRIMSIHKSKGLEFPVVFLPAIGSRFNRQDLRQPLLIHQELGLGPMVFDTEAGLRYPTVAKWAIAGQVQRETLAEEMRILYVALTRAKERLILLGTLTDPEKQLADWRGIEPDDGRLPARPLQRANSFLDWISPAVVGCQPPSWKLCLGGATDSAPEVPIPVQQDPRWTQVQALEPVVDGSAMAPLLAWHDPWADRRGIAAKITVTELKRLTKQHPINEEAQPLLAQRRPWRERPRFLQAQQALTASERGTAMHLAMQHVDHRRAVTSGDLAEQLDHLVHCELMTPQQRQAIDVATIEQFYRSDLAERMFKARTVMREVPFSMALPLTTVAPGIAGDGQHREHVVMQGVIDCLFDEGDGWVLVDYKTDRPPALPADGTSNPWLEQIRQRYAVQIEWYRRAASAVFTTGVKESYLYLFAAAQAMKM